MYNREEEFVKKKRRMRWVISPGFVVSLSVLFYLDRQGILPWLIPGCMVHEAAHWAALRWAGGDVDTLRMSLSGVSMELRRPGMLSYPKELAATLAGPAANLLFMLLAALVGRWVTAPALYLISGLNLGLALWNLLPAAPLDGGRALHLFLSWLISPGFADRLLQVTTFVTALLMIAFGGYAIGHGGGFTLLTTGLWLLFQIPE
jgi:Zn-dependent protease